jgi:transposase
MKSRTLRANQRRTLAADASLLAMILFEKYGQHQPLNRQSERYARESVELSLSTLADQVGGCAALLRPLYDLIRAHVFAGERVHGDETPVPVLAKGQTATGRAWVYVRDDAPFGGRDPPAAVFFYSRDRVGEHAEAHLSVRKSRNDARARPGHAGRQTKRGRKDRSRPPRGDERTR